MEQYISKITFEDQTSYSLGDEYVKFENQPEKSGIIGLFAEDSYGGIRIHNVSNELIGYIFKTVPITLSYSLI